MTKKTHKQHTPKPHDFTSKGNSNTIAAKLSEAGQWKKPAPAVDKHLSKGDILT